MDKEYKLRYLPTFYEDIYEKVSYISDVLKNPSAANGLIDAVEAAILNRLPVCESFATYPSSKNREHPYYRIYVKKYIVFYVVIDDGNTKTMEVRRFLYNGQNRDSII